MLRPRSWVIAGAGMTAVALLSVGLTAQAAAPARYWPQWRGPDPTGASPTANPPLEWSEQKNVRWKVEIPGRGSASPIVWGDRAYLLTAVPVGTTGAAQRAPRGGPRSPGTHRFTVMALDRKTGRTVWQRVAREHAPHEGTHGEDGTWASSSLLTDGERLYAWFESTVIRSGHTFPVLAKNVLDDGFDASPALVDGEIFLRGQQHLYAIAQ